MQELPVFNNSVGRDMKNERSPELEQQVRICADRYIALNILFKKENISWQVIVDCAINNLLAVLDENLSPISKVGILTAIVEAISSEEEAGHIKNKH